MRKKGNNQRILAMLMSIAVMFSMVISDGVLAFAEEELGSQVVGDLQDETIDLTGDATQDEMEFYEDVAEEVLENSEEITEAVPEEDYDTPTRGLVDDCKRDWVGGKINIRARAGQTPTDFNTLQGSCCDGREYAYFAFMNKNAGTYYEKIKIVKISLNGYTYVSDCILMDNEHGNGMTYVPNFDGEGNDVIAIANQQDGYKRCFTMVDPVTMKNLGNYKFDYISFIKSHPEQTEFYKADSETGITKLCTDEQRIAQINEINTYKHGYSSVAYDKESGRFVTILNSSTDNACHDLVVMSADKDGIDSIRYIDQKRTEATVQALDCDRDYIYVTWSPKSGVSDKNFIEVYDWKGNYKKRYTIGPSYEIESLFHTDDGNFYASYHYGHTISYQVQEKYQVKWKKVTKKVKWKKVKWKKVKKKYKWKQVVTKSGKLKWKYKYKKVWKYKWKYKKKKVWKYKTKTRTVTKYTINREGYLLGLGKLTTELN